MNQQTSSRSEGHQSRSDTISAHNDLILDRRFSVTERQSWIRMVFEIYQRMRAKTESYEIDVNDLSIEILPDVYAPGFFSDSFWFADRLPIFVGKKSLLEIGTGTGIVALSCARLGAKVVATDINPIAVKNSRINAVRNGLDISIREGDLYDPLAADERFDFIFWAHPFNNWDSPVDDMLLRSGLDYQYRSLKQYLAEAPNHLTPDGKLLLGTGDSADLDAIVKFAKENSYSMHLLDQIELPLEIGGNVRIRYLIYEFRVLRPPTAQKNEVL